VKKKPRRASATVEKFRKERAAKEPWRIEERLGKNDPWLNAVARNGRDAEERFIGMGLIDHG
jgi:hypothetical protein